MRAFQTSLRSSFLCSNFFVRNNLLPNRRWSILSTTLTRNYSACTFYIQGHQDDWQLFSGEKAWLDVKNPKNKVVFITITAGDWGMRYDDRWWKAREAGALASIQYILPNTPLDPSTRLFRGKHNIYRVACGNTVSYFMRLPDGGQKGDGFEPTKFQSLQKLFKGTTRLTAIDQSTTYTDWIDFRQTLHEIINYENIPPRVLPSSKWEFGGSCINVSDYDTTVNLLDHSDHHYTSLAVVSLPYYTFPFYLTYVMGDSGKQYPPNLTEEEKQRKSGIYKEGYKKAFLADFAQRIQDLPTEKRQLAMDDAKYICQCDEPYLEESYHIREISTGMNCLIQPANTRLYCADNTNGEVELREKGSIWSLFRGPNNSVRIKCLSTGCVLGNKDEVDVPVRLEDDIYNIDTDANRSWNLNRVPGGYKIKSDAGSRPVLDDNGGKSGAKVRLLNDLSHPSDSQRTWDFIPTNI